MAIDKVTSASITDGTIATADIADSAIATAKIADSAVTSVKTSGVGGVLTPAFSAYNTGNISISNATDTVIIFPQEYYDSAGAYDTSTGKFTPQTAGKYFVCSTLVIDSGQASNMQYSYGMLKKNTTMLTYSITDFRGSPGRSGNNTSSCIVDMNGSSDYLTSNAYSWADITGSGFTIQYYSSFSAFKIIE